MTKLRSSSLVFLLLPLIFTTISAQDYSELVFSGFVELASTASTDEIVDFSRVEIQLFTDDNKFVDKTLCSQNGFFLLPIYDKKSYVIKVKPPQESIFEPESIAVNLKGKSNEEVVKITEQSFSFKFLGFSLSEQVRIEDSHYGPAKVKVGLYDSKNQKVAETETGEGGRFKFEKVLTGKYRVQLEGKDNGFNWREGEGAINCELSWKKGQECQGKLVISSFEVKGTNLNQNGILNKHIIFLYSKDLEAKGKSALSPIKDHPLAASNHNYISYSKIDMEGNFKFEHIPKGSYFLKIHTSDKDNKIEIEPESYAFEVQDGPVEIKNPFSINRFSIKGRVVDKSGKGINGIKITLDGEKKAVSNAQGYYNIEKVQVGTYTLEGHHEHLFFKPIANVKLEPTLTTLPELVLSEVDLCGEVSLKDGINDDEFANARITVYLERQGEKRSTIPEQDGRYCFEVQPGRYNIYPVVSNIGNVKQDSLLHPKIKEVEISNEPILDVNFYRPRLSVQGAVKFLANVKASHVEKTKIVLASTTKGSQKTVSLNKDGTFLFEQILPGSYKIYIENDHFCWKEDVKKLDLGSSNVANIEFEQTGFALKYQTTRALEVRIISPDGKSTDTQLLPSTNSYCVESAGTYKIVPDVCYQFASTDFSVSTDDSVGLTLDPIAFLVRGEVIVNESIAQYTKNVSLAQFVVDNIYISIHIESAQPPKTQLLKVRHTKKENGAVKFAYNYYVEPNADVVIEAKPKAKLTPQAEEIIQNLMFNPTKLRLHVGESCILDSKETQIEIRQGLIYLGNVEPELTGWTLTVNNENPPTGVDALVESRQMTTSTFKLGPYVDFHQYEIKAQKEGYKFDPVIKEEGYNLYRITFNAQKLSHLKIQVQDDDGRPVPGALLFVSSMSKKNFLKLNNYTNEKGVFSTHHLVKGDYFVKAVLKEYSFNPPQTTISIDDGEHKEVTITAKRVAYSAYGRVQKLNKGGCPGLKVQAVPQNALVPTETAETDEEGNYRLKGLVPGTTYAISVEKSLQYSTIKPEVLLVEAKEQDLKNIEFLGFERKSKHTVTGNIEFDPSYTQEDLDQIDQIQIRLYKRGDEEPADSTSVRLFRYFEFKDLQPADYTIRILIRKNKNQISTEYTHNIAASEFGESPYIPATIRISREKAKLPEHSAQGSVVAPIVILIVIFLFLNLDVLQEKYKKYAERKSQQSAINKKKA